MITEFGQLCLRLRAAADLLLKREMYTVFTNTHTHSNPQPNYTQEFLTQKFFSHQKISHSPMHSRCYWNSLYCWISFSFIFYCHLQWLKASINYVKPSSQSQQRGAPFLQFSKPMSAPFLQLAQLPFFPQELHRYLTNNNIISIFKHCRALVNDVCLNISYCNRLSSQFIRRVLFYFCIKIQQQRTGVVFKSI